MSTQPKPYLTPEEYLAIERASDRKHEYFQGEMFAMTGASFSHASIAMNVSGNLFQMLKGTPCRVFGPDLRVNVSRTGLYTYPDVIVLCGEPQFDDDQKDTLINPRVIVEILSPSTEGYDRGKKFEHYQTIESLVEYVLVAQESARIDQFVRQSDNDWLLHVATDLDETILLKSIDCKLKLSEIYSNVEFPKSDEPTPGRE